MCVLVAVLATYMQYDSRAFSRKMCPSLYPKHTIMHRINKQANIFIITSVGPLPSEEFNLKHLRKEYIYRMS
jgi:hypothetical protein